MLRSFAVFVAASSLTLLACGGGANSGGAGGSGGSDGSGGAGGTAGTGGSGGSKPVVCEPVSSEPLTLKVVTVNLRHDSDEWERRFPLIADEIVRLDADLVGLQEVEIGIDQGRTLLGMVKDRGGPDYFYDEERKTGFAAAGGEGIGVFSRFPITSRDFVDLNYGRPALLARVEVKEGITVDFYNTHLHHAGEDDALRLLQVDTLLSFMADKSPCAPVFLTGDMNDTDDSDAIKALVAAGLIDTYRAIHGESTAETGNTSSIKLEEGAFEQNPTRRIDYVFAKPSPDGALTPKESEVCFNNHDDKGFYPSDHLGVSTVAEVSP